MPLRLPPAGAVDGGRLVQFVGDALQPGQHDQDREAEVLPADDAEHHPERDVGVAQPGTGPVVQADQFQQGVDEAVGGEQQLPGEAGDHLGQHVGDEDRGPDEGASLELAVQQHRRGDRQRPLDQDRGDQDGEVVADRLDEVRVGERLDVVAEADEPLQRGEPVPGEQAVHRGQAHRQDDEGEEDDQRGAGEERDLQPLAGLSRPEGPLGRGRARGGRGPCRSGGRHGGVTTGSPRSSRARPRCPAASPCHPSG